MRSLVISNANDRISTTFNCKHANLSMIQTIQIHLRFMLLFHQPNQAAMLLTFNDKDLNSDCFYRLAHDLLRNLAPVHISCTTSIFENRRQINKISRIEFCFQLFIVSCHHIHIVTAHKFWLRKKKRSFFSLFFGFLQRNSLLILSSN